ncbi:ParA family protein [Nocardia sp. NPDC052566]|uniref:ParA family protein n=1 Tax=Nocardia sp. NPDC052566 TaxID=3364330 RepID=UPI0037CB7341
MTKNRRVKQKNRRSAARTSGYFEGMVARLTAAGKQHLIPQFTGWLTAEHGGYVLAGLSRKGGTGRTTTTLHLGAALAAKGKKVLLIDLDPHLYLTELCSVELDALGLSSWISDSATASVSEHTTVVAYDYSAGNLSVLGGSSRAVEKLFGSDTPENRGLPELLAHARREFDVVLVDVGHLNHHQEQVSLLADGVFSVLRAPSGLLGKTTYTYSDRYKAHAAARLAAEQIRSDIFEWLDEKLSELDDSDDNLELTEATIVQMLRQVGDQALAEFGAEWEPASRHWIAQLGLGLGFSIDDEDRRPTGYEDIEEAVDAAYPVDDTDVIATHIATPTTELEIQLAAANARLGFRPQSNQVQVLGTVLTFVPTSDIRELEQHRGSIGFLLPPLPDIRTASLDVQGLNDIQDQEKGLEILRAACTHLAHELDGRIQAGSLAERRE